MPVVRSAGETGRRVPEFVRPRFHTRAADSQPAPVDKVIPPGGPAIGKPMSSPPSGPEAVFSNLLCRETLDPSPAPLEPISPLVTAFSAAVAAIAAGEEIAPHKEIIQRVTSCQSEKAEVVSAFMDQIDQVLLADLVSVRANTARFIKRASMRNDLTVGEAMVAYRMVNEQIGQLRGSLNRERDASVDSRGVVEKIDFKRLRAEQDAKQHWDGTTPQGRELVRKDLWRLRRTIQRENEGDPLPVKSAVETAASGS